ncbi:hypothetical protein, conserved [Entamoeba dispar SAW760]|nr:uncharacterized protein EDI_198530 [Entamoeba dispar SAW760]EDR24074.1 hypothetical protein, conserved [Entamoeba dispar SAW760]|eukprot:EDR24074.1 hypothetical protein, conserved [Entamoeba dispar SAW760]
MKQFHFIEHIAISPEFRGEKIGQQVIEHLFKTIGGLWILEVEPTEDEVHHRLRKWYYRNGFSIIDKNYKQPSYSFGGQSIPLWIMATQPLSNKVLSTFISVLKHNVYEAHYSLNRF